VSVPQANDNKASGGQVPGRPRPKRRSEYRSDEGSTNGKGGKPDLDLITVALSATTGLSIGLSHDDHQSRPDLRILPDPDDDPEPNEPAIDWEVERWRRWHEREEELWGPFIERYGLGGVLYIDFMHLDSDPPKRRSVYDDPKYRNARWPHLPSVSDEQWLVTWPRTKWMGYWTPKVSDKKGEEPYWGCSWSWLAERQDERNPSGLTLADLGLLSVIARHDRGKRHCYAGRARLAAEAGLSRDQVERSLRRVVRDGGVEVLGSRGVNVVRRCLDGAAGRGPNVLRLYEWILARTEISANAKFVYCLGVNAARMHRSGDTFTLKAADAAKTLSISISTIKRAVDELYEWGLLECIRVPGRRWALPNVHRLTRHPWHRAFDSLRCMGQDFGGDKEQVVRNFYED
jgi:hypothetical protein